jgi:hypothetical protein
MGITSELGFDPMEWTWGTPDNTLEVPFFNYSAQIGYKAGLASKKEVSRIHEKMSQLGLVLGEQQCAINLLWNNHKPAKLQFFSWQANSGGLATGSWLGKMNFPSACKYCGLGIRETTEHCLMTCMYARRVWRRMEGIRTALQLWSKLTWKEVITGIKPGRRNARGYRPFKVIRRKLGMSYVLPSSGGFGALGIALSLEMRSLTLVRSVC